MNLRQAIAALRETHDPPPRPLPLPSSAEVDAAEQRLGAKFPADFRIYLLEASDVCVGTLEPVTITNPSAHTHLDSVASDAWDSMGVPRSLVPICEDNGDYYCMNAKGEVVYWSHDGETDERWPNLAAWIGDVWLEGEYDADEEE